MHHVCCTVSRYVYVASCLSQDGAGPPSYPTGSYTRVHCSERPRTVAALLRTANSGGGKPWVGVESMNFSALKLKSCTPTASLRRAGPNLCAHSAHGWAQFGHFDLSAVGWRRSAKLTHHARPNECVATDVRVERRRAVVPHHAAVVVQLRI